MLTAKKFAPLAALVMAFTATPALADAITFDASDVGTTYTLNYDGFSDSTTVGGLSAQTTFTLTGISGNTYTFSYTATNTSTSPITGSRLSGFAFDTNPDITSAASTGAFGYTTVGGSYPNGIGEVDVCFKDASSGSCAGGGGGGLDMGASGSGAFTLTFAQPVSEVTLSDFYVRYQAISGAGSVSSATGSGTQGPGGSTTTTSTTTTSSGGTQVPEPGMLGLLGGALIATAMLRRRRRREDGKQAPAFA
jgi:PEP-CTERM motif